MNKKQKSLGFTLIESLVVVTMMMVIIAAAVGSYSAANKKNRDNKRMADLDRIRMALEMYRQNDATGEYPVASGDQASGLVTTFLDAWPTDPKSTQNYYYIRPTAYTYELYALLEISTGVTYANNCGGVCNYRVTNP